MPRIIDPDRVDEARRRSRSSAYRAAYSRLQKESEAFMASPVQLVPPDQTAGFYHDYFCPDHAQQLCFNPSAPHQHRCPQDGREFSGEPYDSAWRWFVNNRLSTMAFRLALRWRLDDDEACRIRSHGILRGYAERYSQYGGSRPRIGRTRAGRAIGGGKATFQSLDEAVWLIPLVRAYDLLRNSLDADARQQVESGLLRPAADHLMSERFLEIHNIECWHNAAIAAVGLSLDEQAWQEEALEGDFGFWRQLRDGVDDDGLWWEGSSSYHFYALAALVALAQMWECADDSLPDAEPRMQRMFAVAVELMQPDGKLPATNDCWFSTSLLGEVCHGVPAAADLYEVAYAWFGDRRFAWILRQNYAAPARRRDSIEALLYGVDLPATDPAPDLAACCLPAAGLTLLRSCAPPSDQTSLLLKYGPHGGGHGHPDKLSLFFYLNGHATSPDLGTPGYGIPLNDSWFRQTLSHNTVIVDGRSQPPAQGFPATGSGTMADSADAWVRWREEPYADISMRRTVLHCDAGGYFVDFFTVEAHRDHRLDWICRVNGKLVDDPGFTPTDPVVMDGDGFEHVDGASFLAAESGAGSCPRLDWRLSQGHMSLFLPFERDTTLVHGRVPDHPASESGDILLRRRMTRETTFVALFHGWHSERRVGRVSPCAADGAVAFYVHMEDGERHLVALSTAERANLPDETDANLVLSYVRDNPRDREDGA